MDLVFNYSLAVTIIIVLIVATVSGWREVIGFAITATVTVLLALATFGPPWPH